MFKLYTIFIILTLTFFGCSCDDVSEVFKWNVINFHNPPREETYKISSENYYIAENNIPTGITPYKYKLFVSIARTNLGIPSTLNYIDLRESRDLKGPPFRAYPDYETNELYADLKEDNGRIVSVYRTRIDDCDRLWFVDTGTLELGAGTPIIIQKPSLWVIDLKTNKPIKRFEISETVIQQQLATGFVSINVDVERRRCDEAFAYIPNTKANKLFVYSLKEDKIWEFTDSTMKPNETLKVLKINGIDYVQNEGISSVVIGKRNRNRIRKIYYHPSSSNSEYSVLNTVLKKPRTTNETTASNIEFKFIGNRGENSQSGPHDIDRNNVIYFTQLQRNAIVCWNTEKPLNAENMAIVAQNNVTLIYPADIKIDNIGRLWYLSNKMPFISDPRQLNKAELNFFIYKTNANRLIDNTVCKLRVNSESLKQSNLQLSSEMIEEDLIEVNNPMSISIVQDIEINKMIEENEAMKS